MDYIQKFFLSFIGDRFLYFFCSFVDKKVKFIVLISALYILVTAVADPDLQKREGPGHPDPEMEGGGAVLKKIFGSQGLSLV